MPTLSFYGTGTIAKSGTATGALVGTGAAQRVSQTFTPTAGSLTLTVTGTVSNAQLEAGAFPTSYVPTTAAAVTRQWESLTVPTSPWYIADAGTAFAEYIVTGGWPATGFRNGGLWVLDDGTSTRNNSIDQFIFLNGGSLADQVLTVRAAGADKTGAFPTLNAATPGVVRVAGAWGGATATKAQNGLASSTTLSGMPSGINRLTLGFGYGGLGALGGWLRQFRYYGRKLTDAELQQITAGGG